MVFAMLTASNLLLGVRLASKVVTIHDIQICFLQTENYVFKKHVLLKPVFLTSTKWLLLTLKLIIKSKKQELFNTQNKRHFHEQSINFELKNELLKIDTNNSDFKEFNFFFFFFKFLISTLQEYRNTLEPIIQITLQKLFGAKLWIDLDFATNF